MVLDTRSKLNLRRYINEFNICVNIQNFHLALLDEILSKKKYKLISKQKPPKYRYRNTVK